MRNHSTISSTLRWAAAALAAAALAGCSGNDSSSDSTPESAGRSLAGTFTVTLQSGGSDPCGAVPDLVDGTPVVVRDADGAELLTGTVGPGTPDGASCIRPLEIGEVPQLDLYRISVGPYGPIEVTAESLAASGGALDLRIGL
jgi:hypothetical protein